MAKKSSSQSGQPSYTAYPSYPQQGQQQRKQGWWNKLWKATNLYNYSPTEEGKKATKGRFLMVIFLLALVMFGVYAYYWSSSTGGQRYIAQAGVWFNQYNPWSLYTKELGKAQDIGNIWGAEGNMSVDKKGILFETFKTLGSEEIPQGSPVSIAYGLKIAGTDVSRIPLSLTCNIKDKNVEGQIIPSNPVYVSGRRITQDIRCRLPKEMTSVLSGTVQVEGGVTFPFSTKDAKLKVYFTSQEMEQSLANSIDEENFFDYLGIEETLPIRTAYNGEPVEIGMGVSTENEQPVVLSPESHPLVGITLNNRWDGKMLNLTSFKLTLPKELSINAEISQNPNGLCPFVQSRSTATANEYRASEEYIKDVSLGSGRLRSFECWLDVSPDLLGNAQYVVKDYKAEAEYIYKLPVQTAVFTVKKVAGSDSGNLAVI